MQYIKIDDIKPAAYNPRFISDGKFEKLKLSIRQNGFAIPILINSKNKTIIAGHQRVRAAKALGLTDVPVFYCNGIDAADEIKFNQIHNGIDSESGAVAYAQAPGPGFNCCDAGDFTVSNSNASIVKETCKLLLKYGNVLCCVLSGGKSLVGANYVSACKLLKYKVNVSVIEESGSNELLKDSYGEFSYSHIERSTWVQGLAQLDRKTGEGHGKKKQSSMLYEKLVIPRIKPSDAVLDFGCGKGAYIKSLKGTCRVAVGVEFYNNNRHEINVGLGNNQISQLIKHIETGGMFDIVVCDSVLNSVDSPLAENSVMACLNLFCKTGGKLFISGRPIDGFTNKLKRKQDKNVGKRFIEYLDKDKFTGGSEAETGIISTSTIRTMYTNCWRALDLK